MITEDFILNKAFSDKNFIIGQLSLSYIVLNNNSLFPWVILVPKLKAARELIDLDKEAQYLLIDEVEIVSKMMQQLFKPDKLNIATLGNIVAQLHIHIIARYKHDNSWPGAVFGQECKPYTEQERLEIIKKIRDCLTNLNINFHV